MSTAKKKTDSIEDYERRFLNSLDKLNANIPKWLIIKQQQYQQQQQITNLNRYNSFFSSSSSTNKENCVSKKPPPIVTDKYNSSINPNCFMSNTKSRYDRIRQRARQQLGTSSFGAGGSSLNESMDQSHMRSQSSYNEKIKNSKSLVLLTANGTSQSNINSAVSNDNLNKSGCRPLSEYNTYYSCSNIMKPLSLSSNSLNTNWYKPKALQLPKSLSCGESLKHHRSEEKSVINSNVSRFSGSIKEIIHKEGKYNFYYIFVFFSFLIYY